MNIPTPEEFRAIRKARILKEMQEWIEELRKPKDYKTKK